MCHSVNVEVIFFLPPCRSQGRNSGYCKGPPLLAAPTLLDLFLQITTKPKKQHLKPTDLDHRQFSSSDQLLASCVFVLSDDSRIKQLKGMPRFQDTLVFTCSPALKGGKAVTVPTLSSTCSPQSCLQGSLWL